MTESPVSISNPSVMNIDTIKRNVGYPLQIPTTPSICPLSNSSPDCWHWDPDPRAHGPKVVLIDEYTAVFHPNWSSDTQAARGTRCLNDGHGCGSQFYWEVIFANRVFGTAMMVGIGTKDAAVHLPTFDPLLGENGESWGLSHKGYIYHKGEKKKYCEKFTENVPTVVGVLYDGVHGTLSFYKDGLSLGVAFSGLKSCSKPLYPMICSTAAKTVMQLRNTFRGFEGLQDRCRDAILMNINEPADILKLPLPPSLKKYVILQAWKTRVGKDDCFITNINNNPN